LDKIFDRGPFPHGGDAFTVNQGLVNPFSPASRVLVIASLRAVMEAGKWDDCRFILPGGQSGDPLSPNYDDQIPLWREGKGIPIAWSESAVAQNTLWTLKLSASV
jgi:acyl-homoserine lactone acylase PvdQ